MENLYDDIAAGSPISRIMQRAAETNDFELDKQAAEVSEIKLPQVGAKIFEGLSGGGVESTLGVGCLFHLFDFLSVRRGRAELMETMLKQTGESRTQAYRCVQVWRHFGAILLKQRELRKRFVAESLKRLSEVQTSQAARDAALEAAQQGKRISIEKAKSLIRSHAEPENGEPPKRARLQPKRNRRWSFVGEFVRLVVEPAPAASELNREAVMRECEAALAEMRRQLFGDQKQEQ